MTREKFAIHYEGKLGDYVGRVFQYQRGERVIGPDTTPELFQDGRRVIPDGWEIVHGADTGTYYSAISVAFSPEGNAYVLAEYPNYRYVGGLPERDESITIPEWSNGVRRAVEQLSSRPVFWADKNSQFKHELKNYGLALLPSVVPRETRTEITREYFQNGRIWLDPRLTVLPFELENAQWPEEATAGGKFERQKDRDHTLDCLEHVLSRRPSGKIPKSAKPDGNWIKGFVRENRTSQQRGNRHMGRF